jgi:hypothetical protein
LIGSHLRRWRHGGYNGFCPPRHRAAKKGHEVAEIEVEPHDGGWLIQPTLTRFRHH